MQLRSLYTDDNELAAAVAVVGYGGGSKWLLGLYDINGDRKGKWCFPGGRLENYESVKHCAERECFEETGVSVNPIREIDRNEEASIWYCEASSIDTPLMPNSEYSELKWMSTDEALGLNNLYDLNRDYILKARKEH